MLARLAESGELLGAKTQRSGNQMTHSISHLKVCLQAQILEESEDEGPEWRAAPAVKEASPEAAWWILCRTALFWRAGLRRQMCWQGWQNRARLAEHRQLPGTRQLPASSEPLHICACRRRSWRKARKRSLSGRLLLMARKLPLKLHGPQPTEVQVAPCSDLVPAACCHNSGQADIAHRRPARGSLRICWLESARVRLYNCNIDGHAAAMPSPRVSGIH